MWPWKSLRKSSRIAAEDSRSLAKCGAADGWSREWQGRGERGGTRACGRSSPLGRLGAFGPDAARASAESRRVVPPRSHAPPTALLHTSVPPHLVSDRLTSPVKRV